MALKDNHHINLKVHRWLRQMKKNLLYARAFVYKLTFEDFKYNVEKQYSTIRAIEIVGEVSKRIPRIIRTKYPFVPWREMAGMRDVLIHKFDNIDLHTVWQVASKHTFEVANELSQLISEIGGVLVERKELPEEWALIEIKDVAQVVMGQAPPSSTYNEAAIGIPLLQGGAEFGNVHPHPKKWTTAAKKIAPRGSILITVRAPVAAVNIAEREYAIGRGVAGLVSNKNIVDNMFLFFVLLFEGVRLNSEASGSIFKSINKNQLSSFIIYIPPLPEQRAIAHVLRAVQEAKEKTEQVIAATKELKKSLMRHLFTYGPVPMNQVNQVLLKDTEIGPIPEHWRVVRLGSLCNVVRGGSPRPKGDTRYFSKQPTNIHWIKISDLTKYKKGLYITATDEFLTIEGMKKSRFLEKGAFVVTNSGTVGIPAFLGVSGCIHDGYLAFLDIDPSINEIFLYYYFERIRKHLETVAPRGTQANLNTTIAKNLPFPLPPLSEQHEIARILQTVDRKIEAEENRKAALEVLFKSLLHDLMTARRRLPKDFVERFRESEGA